jgi:hypothetical protein
LKEKQLELAAVSCFSQGGPLSTLGHLCRCQGPSETHNKPSHSVLYYHNSSSCCCLKWFWATVDY